MNRNIDEQRLSKCGRRNLQKLPKRTTHFVISSLQPSNFDPISGVTTPSVKQKDTWKWRDQIWIRVSRGVLNVVGMGSILSHTQFNQCGSWVLPSLFLSMGTDPRCLQLLCCKSSYWCLGEPRQNIHIAGEISPRLHHICMIHHGWYTWPIPHCYRIYIYT